MNERQQGEGGDQPQAPKQPGVQIGAGLQESRLNTELIDFLNKWGPRVLLIVALVAGAYLLRNYLVDQGQQRINDRYVTYQQISATANPEALVNFAEDIRDNRVGALWEQAMLEAASSYLAAGRRGVSIEAIRELNPSEDQLLSVEESRELTERARDTYRTVLDETAGSKAKVYWAQSARHGLASALITLGAFDEARTVLEEMKRVGEEFNAPDQVALAELRLERLPTLAAMGELPSNADLPQGVNAAGGQQTGPPVFTPGNQLGPTGPQQPQGVPGMTDSEGNPLPVRRLTPEEAQQMMQDRERGAATPGAPAPQPEQPASDEPAADEPDEPAADEPATGDEPTDAPG